MKTFKEFINEQEEPVQQQHIGIHYSHNANLKSLSGSSSGTGIKGAEQERLKDAKDDRIKKRSYFYNHTGSDDTLPRPEEGLGIHTYKAKLNNVLDASKHSDALKNVHELAKVRIDKGEHKQNAFESALLDAGHHGYKTDNLTVMLNRNTPVDYMGSRVGKKFVDNKIDTTPKKFSVFDSMPSKDNIHTSSALSNDQAMYYLKNKNELKERVPSLQMQFGRLQVHKDHIDDFKKALSDKQHPF